MLLTVLPHCLAVTASLSYLPELASLATEWLQHPSSRWAVGLVQLFPPVTAQLLSCITGVSMVLGFLSPL